MNATSGIFVVVTTIFLVWGWIAINRKEKPGSSRRATRER